MNVRPPTYPARMTCQIDLLDENGNVIAQTTRANGDDANRLVGLFVAGMDRCVFLPGDQWAPGIDRFVLTRRIFEVQVRRTDPPRRGAGHVDAAYADAILGSAR